MEGQRKVSISWYQETFQIITLPLLFHTCIQSKVRNTSDSAGLYKVALKSNYYHLGLTTSILGDRK